MNQYRPQKCQICGKFIQNLSISQDLGGDLEIQDVFFEKQISIQLCQCEEKLPQVMQEQTKNITPSRNDIDGQYVFKHANYGLRKICKENNLVELIDKKSQGSKDYFVTLLCYIQKQIGQSKKQLYNNIPILYEKIMQTKIEKYKQQLKTATDKDRTHAEHVLEVYKNAFEVLKAYIVQKDPKKALILSYGKLKFKNRFNQALKKLAETRTELELSEIQIEQKQ